MVTKLTKELKKQSRARYPVQTSVSPELFARIEALRNDCEVLITEILESGVLVQEKKKGKK